MNIKVCCAKSRICKSYCYLNVSHNLLIIYSKAVFFFKEDFIYLFIFKRFLKFIFREGKGGRKRGREISMCGCLSRAPYWGPGPQPRHVPGLGIKLATLWFAARTQSTELHQPGQKNFIYFQREGKGGGKRGQETLMNERNINQLPLVSPITRDLTYHPGMCPDLESTWQPFSLQYNSQPTEPHQPGHIFSYDHMPFSLQKLTL